MYIVPFVDEEFSLPFIRHMRMDSASLEMGLSALKQRHDRYTPDEAFTQSSERTRGQAELSATG